MAKSPYHPHGAPDSLSGKVALNGGKAALRARNIHLAQSCPERWLNLFRIRGSRAPVYAVAEWQILPFGLLTATLPEIMQDALCQIQD